MILGEKKAQLSEKNSSHQTDTGSPEVQLALITKRLAPPPPRDAQARQARPRLHLDHLRRERRSRHRRALRRATPPRFLSAHLRVRRKDVRRGQDPRRLLQAPGAPARRRDPRVSHHGSTPTTA